MASKGTMKGNIKDMDGKQCKTSKKVQCYFQYLCWPTIRANQKRNEPTQLNSGFDQSGMQHSGCRSSAPASLPQRAAAGAEGAGRWPHCCSGCPRSCSLCHSPGLCRTPRPQTCKSSCKHGPQICGQIGIASTCETSKHGMNLGNDQHDQKTEQLPLTARNLTLTSKSEP